MFDAQLGENGKIWLLCPIFCHPNMTPDRLIDLSKKIAETWTLVGLFWELGASKTDGWIQAEYKHDYLYSGTNGFTFWPTCSWHLLVIPLSLIFPLLFVLCIRFPIKSFSGLVHITRRLWASVCDKMWTCVGWSCDRCATWIHLASSRLKIEG